MYNASVHRNELHDCNDTTALLQELVKLRLRKAQLLGFKCFAEWKLQNEMATVSTAQELLKDIAAAAVLKAKHEKEEIESYLTSHKCEDHNFNSINHDGNEGKSSIPL